MLQPRLMAAIWILVLTGTTLAADTPKIETLIGGLETPCAVAIRPSDGTLLVADAGTGEILKYTPPGKTAAAITGLPTAEGQMGSSGARQLSMTFVGDSMLAVAAAGKGRAANVYVFDLADRSATTKAEDAKQKLSVGTAEGKSAQAAGGTCSVEATASGVFATCDRGGGEQIIYRADLKSDKSLGEFQKFIKDAALANAPAGALAHKQDLLLAAQHGKSDGRSECLLGFFNAQNGQGLMQLATGLSRITGLAYSPTSGRLYAVDFGSSDADSGGLYRLDAAIVDGRQTVKAIKIAPLRRPTEIAFGLDNSAYVTVLEGAAQDGGKTEPKKRGAVLKITGKL